MKKYGMNLSEAYQTIGALKVPSDTVKNLKIAEALRIAMDCIQKQIDLGNVLFEYEESMDLLPKYNDLYMSEVLKDIYVLSDVNIVEEEGE